MTVFIIKVIYNTIKAERKKKLFTSEMKSGDKVYFPVASGSINGEILDVNGDDVKIVVTVSKSRVYPND
jgi:preprotein translocase subunit YajC